MYFGQFSLFNIEEGVSIVRLPSTLIITAQWSPDGSMFAVAGLQMDLPETERNVLHFISAYGEVLINGRKGICEEILRAIGIGRKRG